MSERDEGYLQALTDLKCWHENILLKRESQGKGPLIKKRSAAWMR